MTTLFEAGRFCNDLLITLSDLHDRAGQHITEKGNRFTSRAGDGLKTYHKFDRRNQTHSITIGKKMILEKLGRARASGWLSFKELERYGYYKEITPVTLIAHTLIHEYAHALQTSQGARTPGSVHNHVFYAILASLHGKYGQFVLERVEGAFDRMGWSKDFVASKGLTLTETAPPGGKLPLSAYTTTVNPTAADPMDNFSHGDTVSFDFRGSVHTGTIIKMNPARAKVQTPIGVVNVPYACLTAEDAAKAPAIVRTPVISAHRHSIRPNMQVSFDYKGQTRTARVIRCNTKTATVVETAVEVGKEWRVSYALLNAA